MSRQKATREGLTVHKPSEIRRRNKCHCAPKGSAFLSFLFDAFSYRQSLRLSSVRPKGMICIWSKVLSLRCALTPSDVYVKKKKHSFTVLTSYGLLQLNTASFRFTMTVKMRRCFFCVK